MLRPFLLLAALLLAGCGSSSRVAPDAARAEIRSARNALSQAEQADAATHAAIALRTARQKIDQAEAALATGDTDTADRLAEQAALDAEVAESRARAVVSELAVAEVRAAIDALRQEIERNRRAN